MLSFFWTCLFVFQNNNPICTPYSKPFNCIAFLPKALKTETYSKVLSIKNTKKHLKNPNLSNLSVYLSYIMNGWGSTIKDFPSFPQSEFIITAPLSACRNKCLMISHYIKFHLAHCYSKLRFDVDIASKGSEVFIHRGRAWGGDERAADNTSSPEAHRKWFTGLHIHLIQTLWMLTQTQPGRRVKVTGFRLPLGGKHG